MKALLLTAAALVSAPALAASPLEGSWTNPKHSVTVRIAPCGDGLLCGRVTSASGQARAAAADGGTPRLIGTELLSGLEQNGEGSWHGEVFVPDIGRRAEADIHLLDRTHMEVQGCAVAGFMCKSQVWTRVASPPAGRARRR